MVPISAMGFVLNRKVVSSILSEILFYTGVAAFLYITDRVQRQYLDFSPKWWGLITGLRGYLYSAFVTMGFKVSVPLVLVCFVWPIIGFAGIVAVAPFLLGCLAQFWFEIQLQRNGSSCWPVLPIIFEIPSLSIMTSAGV